MVRRRRKKVSRAVEKVIYDKYKHRCAICAREIAFGDGVLDHKIPLGLDGPDEVGNLQWACFRCNCLKSHRRTDEDVRRLLGLPTDYSELLNYQKREGLVAERPIRKHQEFPSKLSQEGLDSSEITRCINTLNESFQRETIVPEVFRTVAYEEIPTDIRFVNIGFDYRLPREWFLSNQKYSNIPMFQEFGRRIALWEQGHIQHLILNANEILNIECGFSFEAISETVEEMFNQGLKPNAIFAPVKYLTKIHHWEEVDVKYNEITPRPRLDTSLVFDSFNLKVILSISGMPLQEDIIILDTNAIRLHAKRYPKYGILSIALGNDRLYPNKKVEVIAGITINCEINPKGISILRIKK